MDPRNLVDRARPRGTRPAVPIPPTTAAWDSQALANILGIEVPTVYVNDRNARGLPAIGAGVRMVANAGATMLTEAKVRDSTGALWPTRPAIVDRPCTLYGSFEFWAQLISCLMMRGNYIAIPVDFDLDGWPRQVVPIHPDTVDMDVTHGLPLYRTPAGVYRWDEVVHIRTGATVGSLWGEGIVTQYRRALSTQLYEQNYSETSFSTGGVPSAVISLDVDKVPSEVAQQVSDDWIDTHGGTRKPAVVPRSISIQPLSWSPEDAQFIEARQLSIAEAALICGLDPADLGASISGGGLTYANLTDRQLSRFLQSYAPWLRLVEEAWSDLLPGGNRVEGDPEALLRTSTKERYEIRRLAQEIGIETPAESRELEGRPPAPTTPPAPTEEDTPDA